MLDFESVRQQIPAWHIYFPCGVFAKKVLYVNRQALYCCNPEGMYPQLRMGECE